MEACILTVWGDRTALDFIDGKRAQESDILTRLLRTIHSGTLSLALNLDTFAVLLTNSGAAAESCDAVSVCLFLFY